MAKGIDEEITGLDVDWNGYKGSRVQDFVKRVLKEHGDSLKDKAGVFYYDTTNNRYLVFADEEARDEYLADTSRTDLLIGNFDAPFNYSASINLLSPAYTAILSGTTGNEIRFTFDVTNKQGMSTGDNIVCTFTFVKGSTKKVVTARYRAGQTVSFDIDKYLSDGTNTVTIGIVGENTLAATTMAVVYQVVNLSLNTSLDISKVYNLKTDPETSAEVEFTVGGYGVKTVEWYLDGSKLESDTYVDEVTASEATRTKYIPLANLSQGTHSLQIRAYTVIDGERFYSRTLYYELIVYTVADKENIIAIASELPIGVLLAEDSGKFQTTQYEDFKFSFAVFSPTAASTVEVSVEVDDVRLATVLAQSGEVYDYSFSLSEYGDRKLRLVCDEVVKEYPLTVLKSSISLEEITDNLELALSATGKSNSSSDKAVWQHGSYKAAFSGFEWNEKSGWNGGALIIPSGASVSINCSPLADDATVAGKTIEFEIGTKDVMYDDAVVLDLTANGTGLKITASEASLKSAGGAVVSTKFKSDELIRISVVINKKSGTSNKCLAFLYVDGVLCGAVNYAGTDSFVSEQEMIFSGSDDATIMLRSIRIYNKALTADQIINNYALYQNNSPERVSIVNRNNILSDTGSVSYEKLANQLPVLLITGDIPTLEATTDKKTAIVVDVEYINNQDPSRSFRATSAKMTPQGTSSMSYPKKNYRLYTNDRDDTKLYDANGKEVADRLYSFKEGAIPVSCWCLKADYAESSGSHNTGIARLWNDVMKNAKIDGEYKLRTKAQQAAIDSGYQYDVRTAVDGFPIVAFYRPDSESDYIFLGKYNFNNDKSTENVFGFRDIPGFDNTKMQCWELLNNGHHLALFQDVDKFDEEWSDAFESRYPDSKTPDTSCLKDFATWLASVSQQDFATQKWEHLDLYKVAAYYIYLMRFGAVDQVVKNAMLTSEDGVHFYFINYDNDTINGLRNDGYLGFAPNIDRQSLDDSYTTEVYCYAGHDSQLWNMLEADDEFMELLSVVDNALYTAGLSYKNVVEIFDDKQSSRWCERVFNADAQYKYVSPFNNDGTNNLYMLQGNRRSHRKWWLSKRFSIYDSQWVTGDYKSACVELKLASAPIGQKFSIVAGYPLRYGYGVNNVAVEKNILLEDGKSHEFITKQVLNIGDPLRIYAAYYLKEVDLSGLAQYLSTVTVSKVFSETLGTKLTSLILGNKEYVNSSVSDISGLGNAQKLKRLDITNFSGLTNIALKELKYLTELRAFGSGLTSAEFAKGAKLVSLELPLSVTALVLDNSPISYDDIFFGEDNDWSAVRQLTLRNCPALGKDFGKILSWYRGKSTESKHCSLEINNIDWKGITPENLIELGQLAVDGGTLSLKGKIVLSGIDSSKIEQQLYTLRSIFGDNVFNKDSELYINVPDSIFLIGPTDVLEGGEYQFEATVFSDNLGTVTYGISSGSRNGTSINRQTGVLTVNRTNEDGATITIRAIHTPTSGTAVSIEKSVKIHAEAYPYSVELEGVGNITEEYQSYKATPSYVSNYAGKFHIEWELTGDITEYVEISSASGNECQLHLKGIAADTFDGTLTVKLIKDWNNYTFRTASMAVSVLNPDILMTNKSNPEVMKIMYAKKLAANSTYMTKAEAAAVLDSDLQPGSSYSTAIFANSSIKSFNEFAFFTSITSVPAYCFYQCQQLNSIKLPPQITKIGNHSFYRAGLRISSGIYEHLSITIPTSVTTIQTPYLRALNIYYEGNLSDWMNIKVSINSLSVNDPSDRCVNFYANGDLVTELSLSSNVSTSAANAVFLNNLQKLTIGDNVTSIVNGAFRFNEGLETLHIGAKLPSSSLPKFARTNLKSITVSEQNIDFTVFKGKTLLNSGGDTAFLGTVDMELPSSVTVIGDLCYNGLTFPSKTIAVPDGIRAVEGFNNMKEDITLEIPSSCEVVNRNNCLGDSGGLPVNLSGFNTILKVKQRVSGLNINASALTASRGANLVVDLWNEDSITLLNILNTKYTSSNIIAITVNGEDYPEGRDITIGDESIGIFARYVKSLGKVTITGNPALPANVFDRATISSVDLGNKLTAIPEYGFYQATVSSPMMLPKSLTSIGYYAFASAAITRIESENSLQNVTTLAGNCFSGSKFTGKAMLYDCKSPMSSVFSASTVEKVLLGLGVNSITGYGFQNCANLTTLTICNPNVSISSSSSYSQVLEGTVNLSRIIMTAMTAPKLQNNIFGRTDANLTGRNAYDTGTNVLYVPKEAEGYEDSYWGSMLLNASKCGFTKKEYYEGSCEELTVQLLTKEVLGAATNALVKYRAKVKIYDTDSDTYIDTIIVEGTGVSNEFEPNTADSASECQATFSYLNQTAEFTVKQRSNAEKAYIVHTLEQWQLDALKNNFDPSVYEGVYDSVSNFKTDSAEDAMLRIDIFGYTNFKIFLSNYIYTTGNFVIAGELDAKPTKTSNKFSGSGKNNYNNLVSIANYNLVEYTGIDGGFHSIYVIHTKASSSSNDTSRGYLLVPKGQ